MHDLLNFIFAVSRFAKKVYRVEENESTLEVIVYRGMDKSGLARVGPDLGSVRSLKSIFRLF